jgi:thiol-disulfide isomerase/thioredoxin
MVTEIDMSYMMQGQEIEDTDVRVVMFYGSTCGPCKATMPHYESAAEFFESKGAKIKFLRINAWEPEEQATYCRETWGVAGVPTFKTFFRGQQLQEKVGGGDESTMKKFFIDIVDEVYVKFQEKI